MWQEFLLLQLNYSYFDDNSADAICRPLGYSQGWRNEPEPGGGGGHF